MSEQDYKGRYIELLEAFAASQEQLRCLSGVFAATTGEEFFQNVVRHLADSLAMDFVFISELTHGGKRLRVVCGLAHGEVCELPIEYDLAGTPCAEIVGKSFCCFPRGVQELFPLDAWLVEMKIEGYIGVPLFARNGEALGLITVMHGSPIDDSILVQETFRVFVSRVSAELERRRSEQRVRRLSSAIEQAGVAVIITDREGVIEYLNPAFTQVTGYQSAELQGKTPRVLNSGNQDVAFYKKMWATVSEGDTWKGRVVNRRKDGSFYPVILTIAPIERGEAGTRGGFVGIYSDAIEVQEMEERFAQEQKMEAMSTMVEGIAHNFNNMLAGITGNLFLSQHELADRPDLQELLGDAEQLSHRAAEMIRQLLVFARKGRYRMEGLDLGEFSTETSNVLSRALPKAINFQALVSTRDLPIDGDRSQLHQVLMNLISNARDAVEGGTSPRIEVSAEAVEIDAAFCHRHKGARPGEYARLRVRDNGGGIPESQLGLIFDPFFTSKEQGRGIGLGLSMVYGAVKTHGGFVYVESVAGEGTVLSVYLPLRRPTAELIEGQGKGVKSCVGNGELILVADDVLMIRSILTRILEADGYRVVVASDGPGAVESFEASGGNVVLALLDVIMPGGMSGIDAARCMRSTYPNLPVIFLTGCDAKTIESDVATLGNCRVLGKPVTFDDLHVAICELLL